jgi:hypothetical protein
MILDRRPSSAATPIQDHRNWPARGLRPAAVGYLLLAALQAIALARYPHQVHEGTGPGIIYLIFLGVMVLTGVTGLARGLTRRPATTRRASHHPAG